MGHSAFRIIQIYFLNREFEIFEIRIVLSRQNRDTKGTKRHEIKTSDTERKRNTEPKPSNMTLNQNRNKYRFVYKGFREVALVTKLVTRYLRVTRREDIPLKFL